MSLRGELIVLFVAIATALIGIASVLPRARWRVRLAVIGCAMAGLAPVLMYPLIDHQRISGAAVWEWSAVGGPTVQASYRLDGLAVVGLAIAALYAGSALSATTRVTSRSALLRPALLVNAFVLMALVVTDDLVAATFVLGALGATTIFVALLVAPAPAAARVGAYLTAGVQAFALSGLLLTRSGIASFRFDAVPPEAVSPGVVLAATIGAALFAGLYPFVPWGYRQDESGERESLRGLLTMPASVGATFVLIRVVGTARIDLSQLALPGAVPPTLVGLVALLLGAIAWRALRPRSGSRRALLLAAAALLFLLVYPYAHWSHVVLVACVLTVAYAAAVSLALPDQWTVTRYDVTLAAAWIGIAAGTPIAGAGAIGVLAGGALAAVADAFWMPPHRAYIAMLASTTTIVAGALTVAIGVLEASDVATATIGMLAILSVIALELVHVGRRLDAARAPRDLEISAALVSFLTASLVAVLLALPTSHALATAFGRPFRLVFETAAYTSAALAMLGAVLAVVAGAVRPMAPNAMPVVAERLLRVVSFADPVPGAAAAFRALERSATAVSSLFTLFERRAGVWLALVLIVGVLFWSLR